MKKQFPLIAESKDSNKILVCFLSERNGVCVHSGNSNLYNRKYNSNSWESCFNQDVWNIIVQPNEFPKEMYVSDISEENAINQKRIRRIIRIQTGVMNKDIRFLDSENFLWKYAIDILNEETEKELCDWTPDDVNKMSKLPPDHIPVPKPPIGLTPKHIVQNLRMTEILAAIERYLNAEQIIPIEWIEEYNELVQIHKNRKQYVE